MKNAKKLLSILLSLILASSVLSVEILANANVINDELVFGTTQNGNLYYEESSRSKSFYHFDLTSYTTLKINYEASEKWVWISPKLEIIKESDYHNYCIERYVNKYMDCYCEHNDNYAWLDENITLSSGSYYLIITAGKTASGGTVNQEYSLTVTPTVNQVKNFKATTTTNSVDLKWTGTMGANGYQIEKYTSNGYVWVADTNSIGYFENGLNSGTVYKYRIRGTVFLDNAVYYGDWTYVTAVTKPAKVGIKTPATNKKHQIIAKWNKVSGASGYQVQFAKNKSCSSVVANKTTSGASYTGKNFTKNKKYYVRVRAYKTVNGTMVYGAWSGVKAIKCK